MRKNRVVKRFLNLYSVLENESSVNLKTKILLYKRIVLTKTAYANETWPSYSTTFKQLDKIQQKF